MILMAWLPFRIFRLSNHARHIEQMRGQMAAHGVRYSKATRRAGLSIFALALFVFEAQGSIITGSDNRALVAERPVALPLARTGSAAWTGTSLNTIQIYFRTETSHRGTCSLATAKRCGGRLTH